MERICHITYDRVGRERRRRTMRVFKGSRRWWAWYSKVWGNR